MMDITRNANSATITTRIDEVTISKLRALLNHSRATKDLYQYTDYCSMHMKLFLVLVFPEVLQFVAT